MEVGNSRGVWANSNRGMAMTERSFHTPVSLQRQQSGESRNFRLPLTPACCLCCSFWFVVGVAVLLQGILMFAVYYHDDSMVRWQMENLEPSSELLNDQLLDVFVPVQQFHSMSLHYAELVTWVLPAETWTQHIKSEKKTYLLTSVASNSSSGQYSSPSRRGPLSVSVINFVRSIDDWIERWASKKTSKLTRHSTFSISEKENISQALQSAHRALTILETVCNSSCAAPLRMDTSQLIRGRPLNAHTSVDESSLFLSCGVLSNLNGRGLSSLAIFNGSTVLSNAIHRLLYNQIKNFQSRLEKSRSDLNLQRSDNNLVARVTGAVANRIWQHFCSSSQFPDIAVEQLPTTPHLLNNQSWNADSTKHRQPNKEFTHDWLSPTSDALETIPSIYNELAKWELAMSSELFEDDWLMSHGTNGEIAVAFRWQKEQEQKWRLRLFLKKDFLQPTRIEGFTVMDYELAGSAGVSALAIDEWGVAYARLGDTVQFRISPSTRSLYQLHLKRKLAKVEDSSVPILPVAVIGPLLPQWASWHVTTSIQFLFGKATHFRQSDSQTPSMLLLTSSVSLTSGSKRIWIVELHELHSLNSTMTAFQESPCNATTILYAPLKINGLQGTQICDRLYSYPPPPSHDKEWRSLFARSIQMNSEDAAWWLNPAQTLSQASRAALIDGRFPKAKAAVMYHGKGYFVFRLLLIYGGSGTSVAEIFCEANQCTPIAQFSVSDIHLKSAPFELATGPSAIWPIIFRRSKISALIGSNKNTSTMVELTWDKSLFNFQEFDVLAGFSIPSKQLHSTLIKAFDVDADIAAEILDFNKSAYIGLLFKDFQLIILKVPLTIVPQSLTRSLNWFAVTWNGSSTEVRLLVVQLSLCFILLLLDRIVVRIILRPLAHQRRLRAYVRF